MLDALYTAWAAQSPAEMVAVALGVLYIGLATRENPWCWVAGFGSTLIYVFLFWGVGLVMESALQVFYLAMSVFGFVRWRRGQSGEARPIQRWNGARHGLAVSAIAVLTLVTGWGLSGREGVAFPYLDAFTTWASVVTTGMVAYKVLGNWVYWLVINAVGMYLYTQRGLLLTTVLYGIYWGMALLGWVTWVRRYRAQA